MTYSELNERSNLIAHSLLQDHGDAPEAVALLLPQGVDLVAAIMGVLKAGKYYLGLDSGFPVALLRGTVAHSGARMVLTSSNQLSLAKEIAPEGVPVLVLDGPEGLGRNTGNPGVNVSPDHLAYVFYTSGSTGRPKGVIDSHRNVLHNVMRYTNTLRIGPADRMTLLQSASFSGSVSSLFGALLNGACSLPLDLHVASPPEVARWLFEERITIYHSVPAIFRSVFAECVALPDLRTVRLEGDQASKTDLRLFASKAASHARLVNGLGTTETGLVRQFFVSPSQEVPGSVVPIGYPVQDMDVFVVDENHGKVPVGEVGEIAVRSRYLAVGYWRDPDLTRERFLADRNDPEVRTYLTGDLGRMRPDGCLEHLGRTGHQTKIRGIGIELGEIEALLGEHESVRHVAVMAHGEGIDARLVAHVAFEEGGRFDLREMRHFLSRDLPDYMVPSLLIELSEFPLTSNGKLDRKALPDPETILSSEDEDPVAPRTPTEEALAKIWAEVLGRERVGVHDDFLGLGANSMHATQVMSRVARRMAVALSLRDLFESPTVAELAERIDAQKEGRRPSSAPSRGTLQRKD